MAGPNRLIHSVAGLVACCLAFLTAKSIASNGAVKIDAIEFWLIGLLPYFGARVLARVSLQADAQRSFGFILSAWLASLIGFVLLRDRLVAESFDVATAIKVARPLELAAWLPTLAYVALGVSLATAWYGVRNQRAPSPLLMAAATLFCAACLHILLFLIPAS